VGARPAWRPPTRCCWCRAATRCATWRRPRSLAAGALEALRAAAALRAAGRLPRALSLWAVANPLTERAARTAAKARTPASPTPSAIALGV